METAQMSADTVKEIILAFPEEEKMMLIRELEKDVFPKRFDTLLRDLKDVPLSYGEINEEVEYVRSKRYNR